MLRVSWDTAFTYAAKAMIIIATRYSGEAGARRLREQGYAPEMIEMMKGAGTRMLQASRRACRCWASSARWATPG